MKNIQVPTRVLTGTDTYARLFVKVNFLFKVSSVFEDGTSEIMKQLS